MRIAEKLVGLRRLAPGCTATNFQHPHTRGSAPVMREAGQLAAALGPWKIASASVVAASEDQAAVVLQGIGEVG